MTEQTTFSKGGDAAATSAATLYRCECGQEFDAWNLGRHHATSDCRASETVIVEDQRPKRRGKRLYGAYLRNFGMLRGWVNGEALVDVSHCSAALMRRHRYQPSLVIRPVARIAGTNKFKAYPEEDER